MILKFIQRLKASFLFPEFGTALAAIICVLISAYSVWYVSAGMFPEFPRATNAYLDLAQSFLHGQLSLLDEPDPRLIALDDPYDPARRDMPYRWDASYYNGEYYLYWGPVPALILAAFEGVTGISPPASFVNLASYIGTAAVLLALLLRLKQAFFPNAPPISSSLFLVFGVVNLPYFFLLGRVEIYETSIIAGQFFLLLGLLGWTMFITGSKRSIWLIASSLCWGLAAGSRYNLLFAVLIFLSFALAWLKREAAGGDFKMRAPGLLLPIFACLAALGAYNLARFGNPFEIGLRYQLNIYDMPHESFSASYALSNLYVYLFYPIKTSDAFPFVHSTLPPGLTFDEVTAGLLPAAPGMWLVLLAIPLCRVRTSGSEGGAGRVLFSMIAAAGFAQFLFLLFFFYAAMRYMADFYLEWVLIAALLAWKLDGRLLDRRQLRFAFWLLVFVLTVWTAGIGIFGGFDIPPGFFRSANPELYARLAEGLNALRMILAP
jgi:hypothetical protein